MGGWDHNGSWGDWLGGLDSAGSGQGSVTGSFECGDEHWGSGVTELVGEWFEQVHKRTSQDIW
jgi:hypothetical protein